MNDEYDTDVSGEVNEARELKHEAECYSLDIEQGIEPAGLYEWFNPTTLRLMCE